MHLIPDIIKVFTLMVLPTFFRSPFSILILLLALGYFALQIILSVCFQFYALWTLQHCNFIFKLHDLNLVVFVGFLNVICRLWKCLICIHLLFLECLVLIAMHVSLFIVFSLLQQQIQLFLMSGILLLYFVLKQLLLNKSSLLLPVIGTFIPRMRSLS